jgi:hypothetical protein
MEYGGYSHGYLYCVLCHQKVMAMLPKTPPMGLSQAYILPASATTHGPRRECSTSGWRPTTRPPISHETCDSQKMRLHQSSTRKKRSSFWHTIFKASVFHAVSKSKIPIHQWSTETKKWEEYYVCYKFHLCVKRHLKFLRPQRVTVRKSIICTLEFKSIHGVL